MSVEELESLSKSEASLAIAGDDTKSTSPISITKSSSSNVVQQMTTTRSQSFHSSSTTSSTSSIASSMTVIQQQQQQQLHSSLSNQLQQHQNNMEQHKLSFKSTQGVALVSSSVTGGKSKFHSFLQQPEMGLHEANTSQFLSTSASSQQQQKFVRQFVRSSSAHSDSVDKPTIKCIRSSSQQMEDDSLGALQAPEGVVQQQQLQQSQKMFQQQSVLISKSAETIEGHSTMGTGIRNTLTLSGGFLAPPNRKLTILSPIHAPPGLHDMLKRHGRSPCSPRLVFPSAEPDLFG